MNTFTEHSAKRLFTSGTILLILCVVGYVLTRNVLILFAPLLVAYGALAITNWKNAYWLLILCLPCSVQLGIGSTFSLSLPDEPICWLFCLLFLLLLANDPRILPRWWYNDPLLLIIMLQFVWLIVAVGYSTVFFLSVKFLLAKVWYLICFFIFPVLIFKDKPDFKKGFLLFLLPMLGTIIIILYRLYSYHFHFDKIGASIGDLYMNHVEYAAVISIFYPVIWVAWPLTSASPRWMRVLLFLLILFFIPALFFTYARVAILAVLFAAVVGVAIRLRLVNFIMPAIYAVIIMALLYLAHDKKYITLHPDYYHTTMHDDYSSHISSTFQGKDVSSMERLHRWVAAVRMSADKPITGYGPHGFVYNYKRYVLTLFKTFVSNNREHSTTHNYFLYMLTEQGWPAMLLYALLVLAVLAHAQRTYHRFNDRFYKYCTLGLAMAFAAAFVNNFFSELIETHKAGALFYLIIALLMILRQKSKEEGRMVLKE